jgi:hypothetical protein
MERSLSGAGHDRRRVDVGGLWVLRRSYVLGCLWCGTAGCASAPLDLARSGRRAAPRAPASWGVLDQDGDFG